MSHRKFLLITILILFIGTISCNNDSVDELVIWTGPTTTFTKADGADWTLEENQDRLTSNVWLTRANTKGIFNIVTETGYSEPSPADTEWAYGTTSNIGTLIFDTWINTNGNNPTSMLNQDAVLHLITDDIYIDIKFTSFSGGGSAGGFSYERSTN